MATIAVRVSPSSCAQRAGRDALHTVKQLERGGDPQQRHAGCDNGCVSREEADEPRRHDDEDDGRGGRTRRQGRSPTSPALRAKRVTTPDRVPDSDRPADASRAAQ